MYLAYASSVLGKVTYDINLYCNITQPRSAVSTGVEKGPQNSEK